MGFGEGVWNTTFWQDDYGTVDGGSQPEDVSMPPEGSPLASECEVVHINLSGLNWTLCYVCRTVRPPRPQLSDPVPVPQPRPRSCYIYR